MGSFLGLRLLHFKSRATNISQKRNCKIKLIFFNDKKKRHDIFVFSFTSSILKPLQNAKKKYTF